MNYPLTRFLNSETSGRSGMMHRNSFFLAAVIDLEEIKLGCADQTRENVLRGLNRDRNIMKSDVNDDAFRR